MNNAYMLINDPATGIIVVSLSKRTGEMKSSDPDKNNLYAAITRANYIFHNDGTPEELYAQIEEALTAVSA